MWERSIHTVLLGFVAATLGHPMISSLQAARDWRSHVVTEALTHVQELEAYSKETVHERFAKELSNGNLEWRLVNDWFSLEPVSTARSSTPSKYSLKSREEDV
jgi:hypothetical protein